MTSHLIVMNFFPVWVKIGAKIVDNPLFFCALYRPRMTVIAITVCYEVSCQLSPPRPDAAWHGHSMPSPLTDRYRTAKQLYWTSQVWQTIDAVPACRSNHYDRKIHMPRPNYEIYTSLYVYYNNFTCSMMTSTRDADEAIGIHKNSLTGGWMFMFKI